LTDYVSYVEVEKLIPNKIYNIFKQIYYKDTLIFAVLNYVLALSVMQ